MLLKRLLLSKECENNTYGYKCREVCGNCLDLKPCNHINGSCLGACKPGFQGDKCVKGIVLISFLVMKKNYSDIKCEKINIFLHGWNIADSA